MRQMFVALATVASLAACGVDGAPIPPSEVDTPEEDRAPRATPPGGGPLVTVSGSVAAGLATRRR